MRTEDGHIISKCLNGDSAAFGLLVDKYKASIYALAYSKLRNFHDAEDVTQDVFLTAYQKLRTLRQWDSFLAWLHAMTLNACKLKMRKRSRRPDQEFIEDKDPKTLKVLSIAAYREERLDESLHDALDSLPEMYRQVLTLYYLGGMSGKEIARFLRISPATVRQRLGRARSRLRKEMHAVLSTEFEDRKLQATFTFRIVEAVKRLKIQPLPRMTGIPWGVSLAAGLIFTAISLSSHFSVSNPLAISASSPLSSQAKALETGEIPVDMLDTSEISFATARQADRGDDEAGMPNHNNSLFLAPRAEDGKWTQKSDMPTARAGSASLVNGKIYLIGGSDASSTTVSTAGEYDPVADTWIEKSSMPTARTFVSSSAINGKTYVIGGWNIEVLSTVEEYDPVADKWAKKANMLTARDGLSTSTVNKRIYAIGGWKPMIAMSTVEEYDPVADKWTKKADMPTARWGHSASVLNGRIYVMGGRFGTGAQGGPPFSTVEEYDPVTDTWAKKSDMPTARWGHSASVVGGKIYAIGGTQDDRNALSVVEVYDPVTDTWTDGPDIPTARWYFSSSVIGGKIYAIGGWTANSIFTSSVEEYDTGFGTVEAGGKMPTPWGGIKSE